MLIDQFIVGVAHESVRKHILDKKPDELTLDLCLQFARTHEATASQFGQFQSSSVASVKHTSKRSSHTKTRTNHPDPGGHGPNHRRKNHVFGVEANNTTEPIALLLTTNVVSART